MMFFFCVLLSLLVCVCVCGRRIVRCTSGFTAAMRTQVGSQLNIVFSASDLGRGGCDSASPSTLLQYFNR